MLCHNRGYVSVVMLDFNCFYSKLLRKERRRIGRVHIAYRHIRLYSEKFLHSAYIILIYFSVFKAVHITEILAHIYKLPLGKRKRIFELSARRKYHIAFVTVCFDKQRHRRISFGSSYHLGIAVYNSYHRVICSHPYVSFIVYHCSNLRPVFHKLHHLPVVFNHRHIRHIGAGGYKGTSKSFKYQMLRSHRRQERADKSAL